MWLKGLAIQYMNNQEKKYNISIIIWQIIVALLGEIGIVGTLYTTKALYINPYIVYSILGLMTIVFMIGIHIKKIGKIMIPVFDGTLILILILFGKRMVQGIIYLVNDIYDSIFRGKIVTPSPKQLDIIKVNELLAILMFCIVVTFLVCANIYYVRSVALSLIMVLPLLCVYTICLKIPSCVIWIFCVTHVLCVSSMDEKMADNVKFIIAMSAAISIIMLLITNTKEYKRPQLFVQMNANILSFINSNEYLAELTYYVDNMVGNTGSGGSSLFGDNSVIYGNNFSHSQSLKGGELGKVDEIVYKNQDIFTMRTPNIGNHQYITVFYGKNYIENSNYWTKKESYEICDEYTNLLLTRVKATPGWKNYLENNGLDMENNFYKFDRSFSNRNIKDTSGIKLSSDYYDKLQKISEGYIDSEGVEYKKANSNYSIVRSSRNAEFDAIDNYLQISSEQKTLIHSIAGIRVVDTLKQKMDCVEYVKNFLQDNYSYTLSPGKIPDGQDFFEYFLSESKEGYCSYFATAATLMFRAYGIPARYVEGYAVPFDRVLRSTYEPNKERYVVEVKDSDAHAWTQIYLEGIGWINVDATPTGTGIAPVTTTNFPNTGQVEDDLNLMEDDEEENQENDLIDETDEEEAINPVLNVNGEDVTQNNGFIGNVIFTIVIAICVLALGIVFYILMRKRKVNKIFSSCNVVAMYNYLEKIMVKAGFLRPEYMEYESFGNYMEQTNSFFRRMKFSKMCNIVTNVDLSGGRYVVNTKQVKEFTYNAKQLRKYIVRNISWYIRWLY